ncbi:hypothetical protein EVAR_66740_1 [Eumeta japonica]|uniref:Uncharacterized protein n=1 Tax=Eumeta variegata TaxID=151549 RepID=A0A4C1SI07_EUMVA|nr:hypothetical protein EVAR_66740_1 [Eumeta japonica]
MRYRGGGGSNNALPAKTSNTSAILLSARPDIPPTSHTLQQKQVRVILLHEHFGFHIDNKRITIDDDLEKQNFQHAGETLVKIWREMKIDNYDVSIEYRKPEESLQDPAVPNLAWYSAHVSESQYLLQVIKCADEFCCSRSRSALKSVFSETFLPPPCPIL